MRVMAYHPTSFFLSFQLARNILTNNIDKQQLGGGLEDIRKLFSVRYHRAANVVWCGCKFSSRHGFGVTMLAPVLLLVRSQCTLFLEDVLVCSNIFFFAKS